MGERGAFLEPLHRVRKQAFRALQQFRDRLSERTLRAFGVPLRTAETEIEVVDPGAPDIRVARVFDRNWELLSPAAAGVARSGARCAGILRAPSRICCIRT